MKTSSVLIALFLSCTPLLASAKACDSLDSMNWLLGDWIADDGKNVTLESWRKVSPMTLEGSGESRIKISNEVKARESLRIVNMSNDIFYLAKPQQNDSPVAFKLTQCLDKRVVFENPSHDFPKKLEYRLDAENKLTVTVSGDEGTGSRINFDRR